MANPIFFVLFTCLVSFYSSTSYSEPLEKHRQAPKFKNIIDACWRSDPDWASDRKALAKCAKGFGNDATGGKDGLIYVVTDSSDDDPVYPKPGTLRYGVIQTEPLWIIFERDMVLTFKNELLVNSFKTIDGRGGKIEITNGSCITLDNVRCVIIHGIHIRHCKPAPINELVRSTSTRYVGRRIESGGDAITVSGSSNIWIDHCSLACCTDGLIDIIRGSTNVTISNNHFSHHVKVMLLGHQDGFTKDKIMKVTIAFNHFGRGLVERMPRVRYGYAHVANNKYDKWKLYAIGGSSQPTILSEGNFYVAPDNVTHKEVTKRENHVGKGIWKRWKWKSSKDVFRNGAYFVKSGFGRRSADPLYSHSQSFDVADGLLAPSFTSNAGALHCVAGKLC